MPVKRILQTLLLLSVVFVVFLSRHRARITPQEIQSHPSHFYKSLELKGTLFQTLQEEELSPNLIQNIILEAKKSINLRSLKKDTPIRLQFQKGPLNDLKSFSIAKDKLKTLHIEREFQSAQWNTRVSEKKIERKIRKFQGKVLSTLWESAESADMDPHLISKIADVFAWQVDFAREIRRGDRWRISVEEEFVEGEHFSWGQIQVAELQQSQETYQAILYEYPKGEKNYYDFDGNSLRRVFLKSPLRFGRISSRFKKRRFHPILKRNIPHRGVDYAAPRGTPIRSVGSGRIVQIGRNGGAGKMIKIRHNGMYSTVYMHLHNYAKGMKRGRKVKQGELIGYVGSTGLATGPHLHFEFHKFGKHINPLGHNFPSAAPLPKQRTKAFQKFAKTSLKKLPKWNYSEEKIAHKN